MVRLQFHGPSSAIGVNHVGGVEELFGNVFFDGDGFGLAHQMKTTSRTTAVGNVRARILPTCPDSGPSGRRRTHAPVSSNV